MSRIGDWKLCDQQPGWICPLCRKVVGRPRALQPVDDDDGMTSHVPDEFDLPWVDCWDGGEG